MLFELQVRPDSRRFGLSGSYVFLPTLTGSLPHTRAFASAFWDGPAHTWLAGFDIGVTVHYTGQYEDNNMLLTGSLKPTEPRSGPFLPSGNFAQFPEQGARKIREWTTLDLIASYTFNLPPPAKTGVPGLAKNGGKNVMTNGEEKNILPAVTAEYNPCGWRSWLNQTTITLGIQNVFDSDPPFVAGGFGYGYDGSLANVKGRFCYVQLKKKL